MVVLISQIHWYQKARSNLIYMLLQICGCYIASKALFRPSEESINYYSMRLDHLKFENNNCSRYCWVDVRPGHHLPRPFQYYTMQQEERRNKTKTIRIRGSVTKGLVFMGHTNFTMKKNFCKRRSYP